MPVLRRRVGRVRNRAASRPSGALYAESRSADNERRAPPALADARFAPWLRPARTGVHGFARRLQIQEKLTAEIAQAIDEILEPKGVGVVIEAEHSCMTLRGVNTPGSSLTTSRLLGVIRDDARTRQEFLRLARGN